MWHTGVSKIDPLTRVVAESFKSGEELTLQISIATNVVAEWKNDPSNICYYPSSSRLPVQDVSPPISSYHEIQGVSFSLNRNAHERIRGRPWPAGPEAIGPVGPEAVPAVLLPTHRSLSQFRLPIWGDFERLCDRPINFVCITTLFIKGDFTDSLAFNTHYVFHYWYIITRQLEALWV